MPVITIDGTEYDTDQLSDKAKAQLASIQACDTKLQQLQVEIAMIQTARTAYGMALKGELPDSGTVPASDAD
jgi:hypothetical protein